jgi:hypothetical protein
MTQGTTNNVFYSTNYGASWTALTLGSSPMTGCAISYDGSYITVSNATTVYTLNLNGQGYTVALGNQAGLTNQGQNAIAIGNQAGQTNQSAGSIILNGTGSALNAYGAGFYVAPVAPMASSATSSVTLLGYGADNQITQATGVYAAPNGYVGIGTAAPNTNLHVAAPFTVGWPVLGTSTRSAFQITNPGGAYGLNISCDSNSGSCYLQSQRFDNSATAYSLLLNPVGGNVGVGMTTPVTTLTVYSTNADSTAAPDSGTPFSQINIRNSKTGSSPYAMSIGMDQTYGCGFINAAGNSAYQPVCLQTRGGNVGIGITSPGAPLQTYKPANGLITMVSAPGINWYTIVGNYASTSGTTLTIPIVNQGGNWSTTMFRIQGFNGRYNNGGATLHFIAEGAAQTLSTGYGTVGTLRTAGNISSVTFNVTTVSIVITFTNAYGSGNIATVLEYCATLGNATIIPDSISAN